MCAIIIYMDRRTVRRASADQGLEMEMSKQFLVSANGTPFGVFEGADEQAARDACAMQAGYASEADMESQLEQASDLVAVEVVADA